MVQSKSDLNTQRLADADVPRYLFVRFLGIATLAKIRAVGRNDGTPQKWWPSARTGGASLHH
jgi:hypothetical protein